MNPIHNDRNGVEFDSYFESGNLDTVIETNINEFDCFMRIDTNTCGHNQWYA